MAPRFQPRPVRVQPPATSANIGPGFDSLGLALDLYDEIDVRVSSGGLDVDVTGEGAAEVSRDERHLLVRSMRAAFDRLGGQPSGLSLRCHNRIPHARGLGSSSAAIVAGIVAARALVEDGEKIFDDAEALALASELEGHPDNVAACLLGGVTIAWTDNGTARAVRLDPAPGLSTVVFVPEHRALTEVARSLLPDTVPHADAAANAGRAALLGHALTADPSLLLPATRDWLHQDYRRDAMPASLDLVGALRDAAIPAVISGAGPTVLAFAPATSQWPAQASSFAIRPLSVNTLGTVATPLSDSR